MTRQKLLSITIPTWNRSTLLEEQLTLITQQIIDYQLIEKIEVVISDNGSDDSTEEVVTKFMSNYDFIVYNNNGINKGARFNLLKALEMANGEFVIFLGDDDRYKKDGLYRMINCLEENTKVDAVFDSYLFKSNTFTDNSFISLDQLLLNFYYNIGNAGMFIIKTSLMQYNIKKFGYEYFSLSWPQTQLIVLSLNYSKSNKILLRKLNLYSESKHDKLMMYNSYYLLRGLYFDLADAIDTIKMEITISCHAAARQYLKNQIIQNTLNILQCGIFVDDHQQKNQTITYININKYKFSKSEIFFLNIIVIGLYLPSGLSKILSNLFIYVTKGRRGLIKKNNFVKLEKNKILNKQNNDKTVRTFDFNF